MRLYLVDGTNAARRGHYDPRFPEMEERSTEVYLCRLGALAAGLRDRVRIEVFFDGPRRPMPPVEPPVHIRFPTYGDADDAILGSARHTLAAGRGVVVVTGDGALARQLEEEGARVMGFSELERRLKDGQA
jgi:hypothetical protein